LATVDFSSFIRHFAQCAPMDATGDTVGEVFENYFREFRSARGYILDDQGSVRPRLAVLVDGAPVLDRAGLSDPVHVHARIFVQQIPLDVEYEQL